MARPKVFVLGGLDYKELFIAMDMGITFNINEADLICFSGGTDVNPRYYNQLPHPLTEKPDTERDEREVEIASNAMIRGIPMVGICRGAQLLHVLSGGSLIQHVSHHQGGHLIETMDGEVMMAAANHHQMMDLRGHDDVLLLARAKDPDLGVYAGSLGKPVLPPPSDYEVVFHPKTKALCHQPHPEWMTADSEYRKYFNRTVKELLL